ncbi:uncharacterized protein WCC33_010759 [Rhinophrynus dorsalis]
MGCSSSTQTHPPGSNKPPAKSVETNGPKKSASSDISDQIVDDIETIPDQTKLVPLAENEASINGTPPVEDEVKAIDAVELEASESMAPAADDCDTSCAPADDGEEVEEEKPTEVLADEDNDLVEGENEDAVEAKTGEEIASEDTQTKEEETGHCVEAAEPEIDATSEEA